MKRIEMIPVACDMDAMSEEQRAVHTAAIEVLRASCAGFEEEPDAVVFRYPARPEVLASVGQWIGLERRCCAFLDFVLSAPAGSDEFQLRISGGSGAKAFVLANMVPSASLSEAGSDL